jgi:hypothetical protein
MMMNAMTTFEPTIKYSTFLSLLFSTILLLPFAFVCAHSSALPFPLLFIAVFQLHSYYYELQNFKIVHNFQQQKQIAFDDYLVFTCP